MRKNLLIVFLVWITLALIGYLVFERNLINDKSSSNLKENQGGPGETKPHPLSIEALRKGEYPGSDLSLEQTLPSGVNYNRYLASYKSEGLKIYGLLTIPNGEKPEGGWPVIIFNHGYIPPSEYQTTERYIVYTDAFSRNGYILFRSDYRGHGNSEGVASGGYGSNAFSIDILNAVASLKRLNTLSFWQAQRVQNQEEDPGQARMTEERLVNPGKIGMWGHSMGGHITLRNMVVRKDIKAGVIWAGVVASYPDLLNNWRRRSPSPNFLPGNTNPRSWRQNLISEFGEPEENPSFWNSISANYFLSDISGPLQLHHGTADASVPIAFSQKLNEQMKQAGKEVELYTYDGDDHNLSINLSAALQRSVEFFDKYLK